MNKSTIPAALLGTWKQLTGRYVDVETGEERPGLSKAPNGYFHFAADGRLFNITVDSARGKPEGAKPTDAEAAALFRTLIAYTGRYRIEGDKLHFDVDVSWNESWTCSHQVRTFALSGNSLTVSADIVNPMTGKAARHRLTFEKVSAVGE
ncbi:MAG: lipocalin-like domain-containing protein [Xanthobacteraceae bacterium]